MIFTDWGVYSGSWTLRGGGKSEGMEFVSVDSRITDQVGQILLVQNFAGEDVRSTGNDLSRITERSERLFGY
jgi:hypothetical protein